MKNASNGLSFCSMLTVAFVVLKLIDKIDWSWLWVLSPLWIPLALVVFIGLIAFIFSIVSPKDEVKRW